MPQKIFKDSDYQKGEAGEQIIPTGHNFMHGESARMKYVYTVDPEKLAPACARCSHPFIYRNLNSDRWTCEACGCIELRAKDSAMWQVVAVFRYNPEFVGQEVCSSGR
jgi:ribosomal protein S27AE